jgi:hypothetical protein
MVKPKFSTSSAAVEGQSSMSLEQKSSRKSPWPFMLLILLMLACMGASASIIAISDGQPVGSWIIEPAVLLAFISSIWNFAAGSMLGIAVTITWWRNFVRGTTIRNLHYIWSRGAGLSWFASFRAGVDARNILLLASLIVLVQAINNPLLQRSSHVDAKNVTVADTMMLDMVSQLPDGWLAQIENATSASVIGLREGLSAAQGWWWNKPILSRNATGFQCDGVCKGNVQGTGLRFTCNSTTTTLDFSAPESSGSVIFAMNTTLTMDTAGAPMVVLTTLHASALDDSCMATINVDTCTIEAGLVEYPIVIQENAIALNQEMLDNMTVLSDYISAGDLPTAAKGQGAGPLQGINDFFGYLLTNSTLEVDPATNNSIYSGGLMADMFFETDDSNYNKSIIHKCGLLFSSPTSYALHFIHEFLFRASLQASTDADVQTFDVQRSGVQLTFRSNYHYLTAVLAAMLVALLGLLFQVWAWWELEWNVTMSPVETANAFGTPALQQGRGRAARDILKMAGDIRVIYGGEVHARRVDIRMAQNQTIF